MGNAVALQSILPCILPALSLMWTPPPSFRDPCPEGAEPRLTPNGAAELGRQSLRLRGVPVPTHDRPHARAQAPPTQLWAPGVGWDGARHLVTGGAHSWQLQS